MENIQKNILFFPFLFLLFSTLISRKSTHFYFFILYFSFYFLRPGKKFLAFPFFAFRYLRNFPLFFYFAFRNCNTIYSNKILSGGLSDFKNFLKGILFYSFNFHIKTFLIFYYVEGGNAFVLEHINSIKLVFSHLINFN